MDDVAVMPDLDWDVFVEKYWDRSPVLFTRVEPAPFEAAEVFQAAVLGTAPVATMPVIPPNIQFTAGHDQKVEPGRWYPEAADGSFDGYGERVMRQYGNPHYALVVQGFHSSYPAQWQRERQFFEALWERIGLPQPGPITTLFHGTYEHSPVGVHKDNYSTFMYALHGRKRMRFWPSRPWQEPVTTVLDYQAYLDSSFTVDIEPGQLLYWPHSYYHVGESNLDTAGKPATSVNVGVRREGYLAEYYLRDLVYELTPQTPWGSDEPFGWSAPEPGGVLVPPDQAGGRDLAGELPATLVAALEAFERGFEPAHADRRAAMSALRSWTSGGFLPAPAPGPTTPLTDGDAVRAVAPIHWTESHGTRLCAANGHAIATPVPGTRLTELVAAFRAGTPVAIAGRPGEERQLLEALETFRAVRREPAGAGRG